MGSSGGSGGEAGGDCGVGSIVWVRRRNGSWWPGKILGPEELTTTHLTSPRSGTPVKLLGRDDASVDWYNLEKSKRVKAFRCGEFDDCIERAEASQGLPTRKREKYARREDAILHALELEKQLLKKQGKLGVTSDNGRSKSSGSLKKEIVAPSGPLDSNGGKTGNSKLDQFSKKPETSPKDEVVETSINSQKAKDGNLPSLEDEHSVVIPRMRGLQDFGLKTAAPKRKVSSPGASDSLGKPTVDSNLQTPCDDPSVGRTSLANGGEQMGGIFRGKRSRCVYLPTESSETMDYKEIPSSLAGIPTSQVEDSDCCPRIGIPIEENSSGFMEDDESDSSESEAEADSSETEPDIDEEMTLVADGAVPREAEHGTLGEHGSISSEEHDQLGLSGDLSNLHPHDPFSSNEAVSKWQLKGKRNIRNLTKSSIDATDRRAFNRSIHGTYHEEKGVFTHKALGKSMSFQRKDNLSDAIDEADFDDRDFSSQMVGLDGGYIYTPRAASRGRNSFSRNSFDGDDMTWDDQPSFRGYWGDRLDRFNPRFFGHYNFGGRTRSMLVDVDLKVQASYQKERVPIVSLMSKLNGKAIIGHPIQIETIKDGSSESLIPANDYFGNEAIDHDRTLPPAWRTARRTNFRVPRPHLSSSPNSEFVAESHSFLDQERRLFKESNIGNFNHKGILGKKSHVHTPRPIQDRKLLKKPPKKVTLSSSQKTRTLSSISIDQNLSSRSIHDSSNGQMNGLMKPESSGPTTVACIPVKLVFSRLLEKINRPPSKVSIKSDSVK